MTIQRFEPSRALEILSPQYGTGYRIGGRLVLTANHLLAEVGSTCRVRSKMSFDTVEAKVVWKAQSVDVSLIELPQEIDPCEAVVFGNLPVTSAGETIVFQMYGYPQWGRTQRETGTAAGGRQIEGVIYLADTSPDGLLVLEPQRLPSEGTLSSRSAWEGASGAAIVCNGLVVGVQSQHQNPNRPASLEAAPLAPVYNDEQWCKLLQQHGIGPEPWAVQRDNCTTIPTPFPYFDSRDLGSSTFLASQQSQHLYAQAFKTAIARIYNCNGSVVGTGFLVSDCQLLTCAHVVTAALGLTVGTLEAPIDSIELDFPLIAPGQKVKAVVIFWRSVQMQSLISSEAGEDIAGLALEDSPPTGCQSVQLVHSSNLWGHHYRIYGFSKQRDKGIWTSGIIRDQLANGWVQIEDINAQGHSIQGGFSGAPVWDEQLEGVVGMVVAADKDRDETRTAFIIPTSILLRDWSELKLLAQPLTAPKSSLESKGMQDFAKEQGNQSHPNSKVILVAAEHCLSITSNTPTQNYMSQENAAFVTLNTELSIGFKKAFESSRVKFAHRNRENISFNDLFVYPDLRAIGQTVEDVPLQVQSKKIWGRGKRLLILGSEQAGKTSLAKRLFLDALAQNLIPIFIEGQSITSSKIEEQLPELVQYTYSSIDPMKFCQMQNIVCIVDDLNLIALNRKSKNKFLASLNSIFPRVILIADEFFNLIAPDIASLDDYEMFEILPFNNVLRSELVEKWVALGTTEEIDDQQIWAVKDELRLHVDTFVRKDIVPAKPFHILMILQTFEMTSAQRLELTAYGHCYQYLIYQTLEWANVKPNDIDMYINVLSELAEAILESPSESLDESRLSVFFEEYSKKFICTNKDQVVRDLVNSSILRKSESGLKFRYRYIFYFFAAKKLTESLHQDEKSKKVIEHLVSTIHLEKSSNIILFLTHHSKDPWILDEILYCVMDIFSEEQAVSLDANSLSFLKDFVKEIPEIVLENRDAREERLKQDIELDALESEYRDQDTCFDEDQDISEFITKLNKLFRSIEVCGQILRNRIGSMERNSLESIYEESLSVSLRFLSLFLKFSEYVKEASIRRIRKTIDQKPAVSDLQLNKETEKFYLGMNYAVILGMLYKVSFSLGSAKGRDIYLKVAENLKTPASDLVQEIIELQFEKRLDIDKIDKLHSSFAKNPICVRFLKHIIIRHLYMHDIGFRERQKLAQKLNIPMPLQRSLRPSQDKTEDNYRH